MVRIDHQTLDGIKSFTGDYKCFHRRLNSVSLFQVKLLFQRLHLSVRFVLNFVGNRIKTKSFIWSEKKQFEKIIHEKIWISSLSSPIEKWFLSVKIKSKLETKRCFSWFLQIWNWFLRWLKRNLEKSSTKKGECQKVQDQISNFRYLYCSQDAKIYEC